jgi:hypothetical protein
VPTSFYDIVVLGTHLDPLLCAALLAREGLRVLVLGQGTPAPAYTLGDVQLEPNAPVFVGVESPVVQNVLESLALRQDVRQHMLERHDSFQLLLPENRLDVLSDGDAWLRELGREMPGVRRQAADITRTLSEVRVELDALLGRSLVWPPETFLERQQLSFAASVQRYDRQGQGWTSWNQLANGHPLRNAFDAALPHLSGLLAGQHSDATRARLHAQLLGGVGQLAGGWSWLQGALFSRIRSWGGDVRARDSAEAVLPQGRGGYTISLAKTGEELGCSQLVHGTPVGELSQLLPGRAPMASLFERVGEPRSRAYRCSVHVLLDRKVIPRAMKSSSLVLPHAASTDGALWLRVRHVDSDRTLLTTTALVDEHLIDTASAPLRFVREDALDALRSVIPFLDDHMLWVDSPHDGLPPRTLGKGEEHSCSDPWTRGPHTMRAVYEYPTRRALGVCALPTRTPLRGIYLCNEQVAPGLGLEGSFLAATSVSRLVAAKYGKQAWLRRGPWAGRSV